MKKLKYVLFLFIMLLPFCVKALDLSQLPYEVGTNEGIEFNLIDNKYVSFVYEGIEEININTSNVTDFNVIGSKNIILNSDTTIQNLKFVSKEDSEESVVIPFIVYKQGEGNQSINLTDINVVGYKLKFDSNKKDFVVNVPSDINEVYIDTKTEGNMTTVTGAGLVELKEKNTKVEIIVENDMLGANTYTVTIVKKNRYIGIIIAFIAIFVLLVGVLLFFFRKYQDKFSHVDPKVLESKVKEINVEEIIKQNAENKNINDVSNETITPGVLTPRTMIPEEENK